VDQILEQLSVFWANTEVVLEVLTKKGQHVEQFIGFASKPKLMARFMERLEEYKRFWEGVSYMCNAYITGVQQTGQGNPSSPQKQASGPNAASGSNTKMYSFLDCEEIKYNFSEMSAKSSLLSSSSGSFHAKSPVLASGAGSLRST
jgi:hypothetical protein